MPSTETGKEATRKWLSSFEQRLSEDAERAGLLAHPGMTGTAREFIVRNVLGTFLPKGIEIGSGRVIGADSPPSNQIDIVLFDPSFPRFIAPGGQALFPVEGVVATIEVKSRLDGASLQSALDNALSVLTVSPGVLTADIPQGGPTDGSGNHTSELARRDWIWPILPRTYVFGFSGLKDPEKLAEVVSDWLERNHYPGTQNHPFLPSVIVAGNAVGLVDGDPVGVAGAHAETLDGVAVDNSDLEVFIQFFSSVTRFGWIACHLLYVLEKRRIAGVSGDGIRTSIQHYLPFEEYFNSEVIQQRRRVIARIPTRLLKPEHARGESCEETL